MIPGWKQTNRHLEDVQREMIFHRLFKGSRSAPECQDHLFSSPVHKGDFLAAAGQCCCWKSIHLGKFAASSSDHWQWLATLCCNPPASLQLPWQLIQLGINLVKSSTCLASCSGALLRALGFKSSNTLESSFSSHRHRQILIHLNHMTCMGNCLGHVQIITNMAKTASRFSKSCIWHIFGAFICEH